MQLRLSHYLLALFLLTAMIGCTEKPTPDNTAGRHDETATRGHEASSQSELSKVMHLAGVYVNLLQKYDVVARQLIAKSRTPQRELLFNAIDRTVAGLRIYKEGTVDGWGTSIPMEVMVASEVDLRRYGGTVFSREYAEALDRGMSSFGMVQSKRIVARQVTLLAKKFVEDWETFPKDAVLITGGWYKGFFVTPEGDLLIPGFSFYANVAEGALDMSQFKTIPSYPGHEVERPGAPSISAKVNLPQTEHAAASKDQVQRDHVERPQGANSYDDLTKEERSHVNTLVWKAANKLFGTAKSDIRITTYKLNPETETMDPDGKPYMALHFSVAEPILSDMSKGYVLKDALRGSSIMYTHGGKTKELTIHDVVVQAIDFAARNEANDGGGTTFIPAHREYIVFPVAVAVR